MSAESPIQLADPDGLRESLVKISASQHEFHRFFSDVFDELDVLSAELLRRQQAWQAEQQRSEEECQRQAARLEEERAAIAAEREEVRKQLDRKGAQVASEDGEADGELEQMLEETERERDALRTALETAQTQAARLVQVVNELSETSSGLAVARQEIQRLRDDLESIHTEDPQPQADPALQKELQRAEREREELQQERVVLETELESVRNRAAELAESLAEQRREMAEERDQWTQELKRMRRLLETLSSQPFQLRVVDGSEQAPVHMQEPAYAASERASATAADNDVALSSVMAQFEMLQKDLVRRRKSNAHAG